MFQENTPTFKTNGGAKWRRHSSSPVPRLYARRPRRHHTGGARMRRLVGAGREERKQGATRRSRLGGAAPPTGVKGKAAGNARRGEKKAVARGRKTTGHHTFFALGVPQRRQPQGLTKPGIAAVSVAAAAATSRATEHPRTFRGKRRFRDGRAANTPARTPGCSRKNLLRPVWSAAYICAAGQQAKRGQRPRFSKRCAHTAVVMRTGTKVPST